MIYLKTLLISSLCWCSSAFAGLPDTIEKIQSSIVAVATYSKVMKPRTQLRGTGFAVGNGTLIATNAHVIPSLLDTQKKERIVILSGKGRKTSVSNAEVVAIDQVHDIAVLKISGKQLPALKLSDKSVREGESIAFTGFPIGAVLGLYPVTHRGIISSITPIVIPARSSRELTVKQLKQLRDPYMVYQLDATAYPGNSGSPVYTSESGEVIAIINKVLVKSTKESILSNPSAITYAIPVKYLKKLLADIK